MNYTDEKDIGEKAEKMLTSSLHSGISSFKTHYNRKEGAPTLKDARAKARYSIYGRKRDGNQEVFMRKLIIQMPGHGFVQHFGVDTVRAGGERTREKPKQTTYKFDSHYFKMKATPFIDESIDRSGVIDFIVENITQLRADNFSEEIAISFSALYQFSE